jgi:hypothetical protein
MSKLNVALVLTSAVLCACSGEALDQGEIAAMSEEALNRAFPFELGAAAADHAATDQFGPWRWVSNGADAPSGVRESLAICDADRWAPDALGLILRMDAPAAIYQANKGVEGLDFRFGILGHDADIFVPTPRGPFQFTPWASAGGGWSLPGTSLSERDPDCYFIAIEVRSWPPNSIVDVTGVQAGLQAYDNGAIAGPQFLTPIGGGFSGWAMDADQFDPDGFSIGLVVR